MSYQISSQSSPIYISKMIGNVEIYIFHDGRVYNTLSGEYLRPHIHEGHRGLVVYFKGTKLCLHKIVAEAFIPNPYNKSWAVAIDGDYTNCCIWNLTWSNLRHYVIGRRYERLVIIDESGFSNTDVNGNRYPLVRCVCDCGAEVVSAFNSINIGDVTSCGCRHREIVTTHGCSTHPLYAILKSMHYRCENSNAQRYTRYGGRGITICPQWSMDNVNEFIRWGEANGYRPGLSIERIDNDGHYYPDNCTFIPVSEQAKNRG